MRYVPATSQLAALLIVCTSFQTAHSADSESLPRSTPEAQGVSSSQVLKFIRAADEHVDSMHSFMLVRHGHVVAEAWWQPQTPETSHVLWSLSKSFTSTAVGLAVAEGKLSIDDRVIDFFPESTPDKPSEHLQNMRVRHLLTMTAGHDVEVNLRNESDWIKAFLSHPVPHEPGTHFQYNTPATFMLSAIVQKVTGETVVNYLEPRLFQPLHITSPRWDANPQGISIGGYGLFLRTEDIAKFGQLYLQRGKWGDQQLIPQAWVQQATSKQVPNGSNADSDWNQGYGFQFWRSRHASFRGDGKDGQFCIVMPELDAVVAITANTRDMQGELNVVWDYLLDAFHDAPLPAAPEDVAELTQAVTDLTATR